MGLLRVALNPVRYSYANYLHRNIPATPIGFRFYTTSKKPPTKNGMVLSGITQNLATLKTTASSVSAPLARDFVTSNCAQKEARPPPSPVSSAESQQTIRVPPAPPATGDTTPPQPSNSKYWWIFVLAAAAGGGTLLYQADLFGSPKEKAPATIAVVKRKKIPESSADIPKEIPYLLIGGGTASFAAFRAIKSHDPKAKVMVISQEIEMPYMRPPLSKELWLSTEANPSNAPSEQLKFKQWNGVERSLYYEPTDFYINPTKLLEEPNGGVAVVKGYAVKHIDVFNRKAVLTDGTEINYGECLLATGSSPKNIDIFESAPLKVREKVSLFKTIEDFENLQQTINKAKSVAIVGGGFLGSELACALAKYGEGKNLKVHQLFHEKGNMGKVLPEFLSEWTTERVREEGVNVLTQTQITGVDLVNNQLKLKLIDGKEVLCDHVVVAVGSEPNVSLARDSGLEVDEKYGGYLVNAELEARRHLYVAGDAACFYDPKLGRRRVEHHDHAVVSGRLAGENMVGLKKPYTHQSMFWSDLGPKVGYEAIGIIDSSLPTVSVFAKSNPDEVSTKADESTSTEQQQQQSKEASKESATSSRPAAVNSASNEPSANDDFGKGVIFYLRDEKIIGIVLWNVFNRINTARAVIAEGKKYDDLNEVAKLFEIHS